MKLFYVMLCYVMLCYVMIVNFKLIMATKNVTRKLRSNSVECFIMKKASLR